MANDLILDIATASTGNSKKWKNRKMKWGDLVARLSEPYHTKETAQEFFDMSKDDQAIVKDVGAYFGGYIRSGRRLKANILHRQLVTLDIDYANEDFWEDFTVRYNCCALVHGTHKHLEESPRLRLILPLDREVTPDEYTAISRRIAGNLGVNLFDPTTFDVNRFMYWQSSPCDVTYYVQEQVGEPLVADDVLEEYVDWTDISEHPRTKDEKENDRTIADKAENPLDKKGTVGFFCRTYSISEVIDKYLESEYERSEHDPNRYTFKGGSTHGGAIVYDDLFMYSHHSTDPVCNRLANAYDLVRLHLFEGSSETESVKKMDDLVMSDADVKRTIALEKLDKVDDFDFLDLDDDSEPIDKQEQADWMSELEADKSGKYLTTAGNIRKIVANDPRLKNVFAYNLFSNKMYALRSLPWRKLPKPQPLTNTDYSGLRTYIEELYGISAPQKIDDAIIMEGERNKYHPIKQYIESIKWDGLDRVSELFTFWLGADETEYTANVTNVFLIGCIKRIYEAGCKFDYVVTFVGEQGTGKSTLAAKLGGDWFSDTLMTIKGKEGMEALHGNWIIEMAELSGLRKSDLETQKHFISKSKDSFRPAYGRVSEDYLRQNVFIGTTNDEQFLRDSTGNRRFLPIKVNKQFQIEHPYYMSQAYVDQVWGQAYQMYLEKPYFDVPDLEDAQEPFVELDPRTEEVRKYLDTEIPTTWDDKSIDERVMFYQMPDYTGADKHRMVRNYVSVIEVFVECFGGTITQITRHDANSIRDILRGLKWVGDSSPKIVKMYGSQRVFTRPEYVKKFKQK